MNINYTINKIQAAIKAKYDMCRDEHVTELQSMMFRNEAELLEELLKEIQEHAIYMRMLEDQVNDLTKKLK